MMSTQRRSVRGSGARGPDDSNAQWIGRPVILVGNGVRLAGGEDLFREVVDALEVRPHDAAGGGPSPGKPSAVMECGGIAARSATTPEQRFPYIGITSHADDGVRAGAARARGAQVMVNIDPQTLQLGKLIELEYRLTQSVPVELLSLRRSQTT
jgi:hypothetical protein